MAVRKSPERETGQKIPARKNEKSEDTSGLFVVSEPKDKAEAIPHALLWPIEQLRPNPEQPRTTFDIEEIINLAANLKRLADQSQGIGRLGFIQPLLGHWEPGAFDESGEVRGDAIVNITAGENRWRAAMLLYQGEIDMTPEGRVLSYKLLKPAASRADSRFARIPVIVTDQTATQARRNALFENIMRQNLPILDEAREIRSLMNEENLTFQQAADYLGKTKSWVQARLDALRAAPDVQKMIRNREGSLFAAQRIDRIKEPELRQLMIDLFEAGHAYPKIDRLKPIAFIENESKRKALMARIRKEMEAGDVNWDKAYAEMRKHLPADYEQAAEPEVEPLRFGNESDKLVLPAYDVAASLDGVLRELKGVTLTPTLRKSLLPRAKALYELVRGE